MDDSIDAGVFVLAKTEADPLLGTRLLEIVLCLLELMGISCGHICFGCLPAIATARLRQHSDGSGCWLVAVLDLNCSFYALVEMVFTQHIVSVSCTARNTKQGGLTCERPLL